MTQTISHLFDDRRHAENAVKALERDGFSQSEISILANPNTGYAEDVESDAGGLSTGATIGTVAGVGVGILASLGAIAIPGIGPLVAAGMLATTLTAAGTGAVAGGLAGALIDYGFSDDDAEVYSEAIRRGSTMVTVKTDDARALRAQTLMRENGAVDFDMRHQDFKKSGWTGYDPKAPLYTAEEAARERNRRSL
jgi:hypothetical protein